MRFIGQGSEVNELEAWRVQLQRRFATEGASLQIAVDDKEREVAEVARPLMIQRLELECEGEFVLAQLEFLDAYLQGAKSWSEQFMKTLAIRKIADTKERIIETYSDFVQVHAYGFVGGILRPLVNANEKRQEIMYSGQFFHR